MPAEILTVGHSTRGLDEFLLLLAAHPVRLVVDVRALPRSRRHPHFDREVLAAALRSAGISYEHEPALGGLRTARADSHNLGIRNPGLRGFADYMETPRFASALEALIAKAAVPGITILCAEALPARCHRSLIADALAARGVAVSHILSETSRTPHELGRAASLEPGGLRNPARGRGRGTLERAGGPRHR